MNSRDNKLLKCVRVCYYYFSDELLWIFFVDFTFVCVVLGDSYCTSADCMYFTVILETF